MEPCYVVGYGLIDSLGNNPYTCFTNMLNDVDYSSDLQALIDCGYKITRGNAFDPSTIVMPGEVPIKLLPHFTNSQKMALHATNYAMHMSGVPLSKNVSVIYSTVSNDVEDGEKLMERVNSGKRNNPRRLVNRIPDMSPSHIASVWGFMGQAVCVQSGCSTGLASIDYGMYLAQENDYVIVGGSDAGCFPLAIKYFGEIGALGNHSMPFDDNRSGFLMGDGAATLIIMREEMVEKYGMKPFAKLYPAGKANDALDMTSPDPDGRGAEISMNMALKYVDSVDAVCAHATSTPVGDPIEYETIVNHVGNTPIWAPKGKIGHTLAAASVIEAVYCIRSMQEGVIPHIQNLKETSLDTRNILVRENTPLVKGSGPLRMLNNSFGFGGKCMSQVIELC